MPQKFIEELKEEVATNSAGSGAVAAIGVGEDGEPGVNKGREAAVLLLKKRMLKRFKDAIRS